MGLSLSSEGSRWPCFSKDLVAMNTRHLQSFFHLPTGDQSQRQHFRGDQGEVVGGGGAHKTNDNKNISQQIREKKYI